MMIRGTNLLLIALMAAATPAFSAEPARTASPPLDRSAGQPLSGGAEGNRNKLGFSAAHDAHVGAAALVRDGVFGDLNALAGAGFECDLADHSRGEMGFGLAGESQLRRGGARGGIHERTHAEDFDFEGFR